jgi:MFS transporter, FSR family, fosmidomycin resistance protein
MNIFPSGRRVPGQSPPSRTKSAFSLAIGSVGIASKVWQAGAADVAFWNRKMQKTAPPTAPFRPADAREATFGVVMALSLAHLLNDVMQSLVPAIYPIIKDAYHLDFAQIGLITLAFQLTASMFQPLVGIYTDRRPQPYSLVAGMGLTLIGILVLAQSGSYPLLLLGAALIGTGSSIFHPESTRMARLASGGKYGFAQSLFQVGGQAGQALGPLLAAFIVVPRGQGSISYFSLAALVAVFILLKVGHWYKRQSPAPIKRGRAGGAGETASRTSLHFAVALLVLLMFSKSAYTASLGSYYTFYMIGKFHVSVQASQALLFLFLAAQALGSLIGGHLGDRFGRREIIWFSILGALPFTLVLPYANLIWTAVLTVIIGMIMASAFPAILVYALELLPGKVGMIAGLFYGVSFGLGALSAVMLGVYADVTSLTRVYRLCAFLPLLGLLTWFLPKIEPPRAA